MNTQVNNVKGSNLFRFMSIILLMLGVTQLFQCIGLVGGLIFILADTGAMKELAEAGANIPMAVFSMAFNVVLVILQGVTGFFGLRGVGDREKIGLSCNLGIALVAIQVIYCAIAIVRSVAEHSPWNFTSVLSILINIGVPVVFVCAAFVHKKALKEVKEL